MDEDTILTLSFIQRQAMVRLVPLALRTKTTAEDFPFAIARESLWLTLRYSQLERQLLDESTTHPPLDLS